MLKVFYSALVVIVFYSLVYTIFRDLQTYVCSIINTKEAVPYIYLVHHHNGREKRNKHILMNIINTRNKIK